MKNIWQFAFSCTILAVLFGACEKEDPSGVFIDSRDGRVYPWVKIGDQVWMAENLAYLPKISDSLTFSETEPHYYVRGYGGSNLLEAQATETYGLYGVLYNWPAARLSCPKGWHLPSDKDWKTMEKFLYMDDNELDSIGLRSTGVVGLKLKAKEGWKYQHYANDQFGFKALPGGAYHATNGGAFEETDFLCYFWTSSNYQDLRIKNQDFKLCRSLYSGYDGISRFYSSPETGFSVRCLKGN